MRCLRYRHIVPDKLVRYAVADKRLCNTWRSTLLHVFRNWATSSDLARSIFYWYVLDVLSHTLVKWPFSINALRKLLSLVTSINCGANCRVVGNADGVRIFSKSKMVGFVDDHNRLWRTVMWDRKVEAALTKCCKRPLVFYSSKYNGCIECKQNSCQSTRCAMRYAAVYGTLRRDTRLTTINMIHVIRNPPIL